MYFRFGFALVLVISVSLAGVTIERQCLSLRRAVSRQHYRYEALCALAASLRLKTQQLGAPSRLFAAIENGQSRSSAPTPADHGTGTEPAQLARQDSDRADR